MTSFFNELWWRGFLHSSTDGVEEHLKSKQVTGYIGFDPTASSLHVGSLLPIMGLVHMQRAGHVPIAIAGGGTGMIGDPSGKTAERKLLTLEEIESNLVGIKAQLSRFLDFNAKGNPAKLVNNADWLVPLSMMEFLRDTGKHFSVNEMMSKDSVKSRLENEQGMSFTEFCYSLLQSYDFLELYRRHKCTLQMGGSDQWGNIVSGVDLIRRVEGGEAHGIVFHLITTSTGAKFGKTEAGTIWLDPQRTSPYRFYQFWYNTDDRDTGKYLRFFTLLPKDQIEDAEKRAASAPEKREAQKLLAEEVTKMVHGDSALQQAAKATQVLFGGELDGISPDQLLDIFSEVPSVELGKDKFAEGGLPFIDLMVAAGVAKSKGEARRLVEGGGIYLNNRRVPEVDKKVELREAISGKILILRKGAKNYTLVKLI